MMNGLQLKAGSSRDSYHYDHAYFDLCGTDDEEGRVHDSEDKQCPHYFQLKELPLDS